MIGFSFFLFLLQDSNSSKTSRLELNHTFWFTITERYEEMEKQTNKQTNENYTLISKEAPYSAVSCRDALCSAALWTAQQALEHCCYLQVCSAQCSKHTQIQSMGILSLERDLHPIARACWLLGNATWESIAFLFRG